MNDIKYALGERKFTRYPNALPVSGTFSRDPVMWGAHPAIPTSIASGRGAILLSCDQKSYLDWVCGLGANILGYSNVAFNSRVEMYLRRGGVFSIRGDLELEAASRLAGLLGMRVPGWDPLNLGVRWGLSGSDADAMAIRLARAVTGKNYILKCGYMGSQEVSAGSMPPALGVSPLTGFYVVDFTYNSRESVAKAIEITKARDGRDEHQIAAVIIEQGPEEPQEGWYEFLRATCNDIGALLIVDEVVTGLRYGLGGACERYGIYPDLITCGKSLGNGVPVSALVGFREYMDWFARESPPFCSSTYWGNSLSCGAALTMIDTWTRYHVEHIWKIGTLLVDGLRAIGYEVIGHPVRSLTKVDGDAKRALFIALMAERGILMNRPNFVCFAHTEEHVNKTLAAAREVKAELDKLDEEDAEVIMKGIEPRVLFRNR